MGMDPAQNQHEEVFGDSCGADDDGGPQIPLAIADHLSKAGVQAVMRSKQRAARSDPSGHSITDATEQALRRKHLLITNKISSSSSQVVFKASPSQLLRQNQRPLDTPRTLNEAADLHAPSPMPRPSRLMPHRPRRGWLAFNDAMPEIGLLEHAQHSASGHLIPLPSSSQVPPPQPIIRAASKHIPDSLPIPLGVPPAVLLDPSQDGPDSDHLLTFGGNLAEDQEEGSISTAQYAALPFTAPIPSSTRDRILAHRSAVPLPPDMHTVRSDSQVGLTPAWLSSLAGNSGTATPAEAKSDAGSAATRKRDSWLAVRDAMPSPSLLAHVATAATPVPSRKATSTSLCSSPSYHQNQQEVASHRRRRPATLSPAASTAQMAVMLPFQTHAPSAPQVGVYVPSTKHPHKPTSQLLVDTEQHINLGALGINSPHGSQPQSLLPPSAHSLAASGRAGHVQCNPTYAGFPESPAPACRLGSFKSTSRTGALQHAADDDDGDHGHVRSSWQAASATDTLDISSMWACPVSRDKHGQPHSKQSDILACGDMPTPTKSPAVGGAGRSRGHPQSSPKHSPTLLRSFLSLFDKKRWATEGGAGSGSPAHSRRSTLTQSADSVLGGLGIQAEEKQGRKGHGWDNVARSVGSMDHGWRVGGAKSPSLPLPHSTLRQVSRSFIDISPPQLSGTWGQQQRATTADKPQVNTAAANADVASRQVQVPHTNVGEGLRTESPPTPGVLASSRMPNERLEALQSYAESVATEMAGTSPPQDYTLTPNPARPRTVAATAAAPEATSGYFAAHLQRHHNLQAQPPPLHLPQPPGPHWQSVDTARQPLSPTSPASARPLLSPLTTRRTLCYNAGFTSTNDSYTISAAATIPGAGVGARSSGMGAATIMPTPPSSKPSTPSAPPHNSMLQAPSRSPGWVAVKTKASPPSTKDEAVVV